MIGKIKVLVITLLSLLVIIGCSNNTSNSNEGLAGDSDVTIVLGHANPADPEISHYQHMAEKFKDDVENNSDGRISVDIHPGAELGGEREMLESMDIGDLDAIITATAPLGNFSFSANIFDFPFLFDDLDHVHNVLDGDAIKDVEQDLEDVGFKVLSWGDGGFGAITNSKHPIEKLDDMKNMKIRTMENDIQIDTFKAFGANPTPMAFDELFTSLQQKVVDGQFNPLATIAPNKFYEVQDYMTMTNHYFLAAPLIVRSDLFDELSEEDQKILEEAAKEARDSEREFVKKNEKDQLETIVNEGNVEVITNEELNIDEFKNAVKSVYDKYDGDFKEIISKIKETE